MNVQADAPRPARVRRPRPRQPGAPLTVMQAAGLLNLSPQAVRKLCASGRLAAYRDGPKGGAIRIAEAELVAYQARRIEAGPVAGASLPVRPAAVVVGRRHLRPRAR